MEEFDLVEFAKMFDAAIASNNPAVQKALRNFMIVAAIIHSQETSQDENIRGPLETLIKKVTDLERLLYDLKNKQDYGSANRDYWRDNFYGSSPTWVYNPNQGTTSISTTSPSIPTSVSATDVNTILKDLKFK